MTQLKRALRIVILAVTLPAAVSLAVAPTLIVNSPLRDRLLGWALSDVRGTLSVGSISFGWLTPFEATDVVLLDASGHTVLSAPGVRGNKRLCDLIAAPRSLGSFTLDHPRVEIEWRDGCANVTDIFAAYLHDTSRAEQDGVQLSIEVQNASLLVHDLDRQQQWPVQELNATVSFPGAGDKPIRWKFAGLFSADDALQNPQSPVPSEVRAPLTILLATAAASNQPVQHLLKLAGSGTFNAESDALQIAHLDAQCDALQLQMSGELSDLAATRKLQVDGRMTYDLARLQAALEPRLGNNLEMTGRDTRNFSFAGDLTPPPGADAQQQWAAWIGQVVARAEVGWDSLRVYGVTIGRDSLRADVHQGLARLAPLEVPLAGGVLRLAPQMRLNAAPLQLELPPGVVADHMEITPDMCAHLLSFVAPPLADVTQARGSMSLAVEHCQLPLSDWKQADIAGTLQVHSAAVNPGPIAQELASLLNQGAQVELRPESSVKFRVVQGRVYHEGLELVFPNATLRTKGSVGFDRSLALLVEMPVPAAWLKNTPLAASLQGQAIYVPIGGTLSKPQIDRSEFDRQAAQFVRQSAQDAAQNVLRQGLNRGLDQLLMPRK